MTTSETSPSETMSSLRFGPLTCFSASSTRSLRMGTDMLLYVFSTARNTTSLLPRRACLEGTLWNPAAGAHAGFEPVVEVPQHRRIAGIARIFDLVVELVGIGREIVQLFKAVPATHVFSRRRAYRSVALVGFIHVISPLDQDGTPPW